MAPMDADLESRDPASSVEICAICGSLLSPRFIQRFPKLVSQIPSDRFFVEKQNVNQRKHEDEHVFPAARPGADRYPS
jgi:hypothetical protein